MFITQENIRNIIGRQVHDSVFQNDCGLGTVVSVFTVSGELGCTVNYKLDRLVLKHTGPSSGVIVNGPVSGTINNGNSYVRYDLMSNNYVAANSSERESAFRGMFWDSTKHESVVGIEGKDVISVVNIEGDYRLIRETYTDINIDYFPDILVGISRTISNLTLL
jgi:hypothetical protein